MSTSSSAGEAGSAGTSPGGQMLTHDLNAGPVGNALEAPSGYSVAPSTSHNPYATKSGADSALVPTPSYSTVNTNPRHMRDIPHINDGGSRMDGVGDGRLRNPVPSKLINRASEKDGNFSIMHMDVRRPVLDARDLAAKRTSEMTQAAAIQATRNGYQPVKRSKLVWHPNPPSPDQRQPTQQQYEASPQPTVRPTAPETSSPRTFDSADVKAEQARLLTFLRSVHPVIIVDQLCKGLAYFGGIPGAIPPADNTYPESAKKNGSGALFIGWMSEVFPPADLTKPPFSTAQAGNLPDIEGGMYNNMGNGSTDGDQSHANPTSTDGNANPNDPTTPAKRGRGRPKGSKGSKTRKDKGIKKVYQTAEGVSQLEDGSMGMNESHMNHMSNSQFTSTPVQGYADMSNGEGPPSGTPSGKKRGRPKGSKNKPKAMNNETLPDGSNASPSGRGTPSMDRGPPGGWMPEDGPSSQQKPTYFPSQMDTPSRPEMRVDGLSRHAENWTGPHVADHPQPIGPGAPLDGQAGKRKAIAQLGHDNPAPWTNGQGHNMAGQQQPTDGQDAQNKRQRLSKENGQSGIINSHPQSAGDMTGSPAMHQNIGTATSTPRSGMYDLSSPEARQASVRRISGQIPSRADRPGQYPSQQQQNTSDMNFYQPSPKPMPTSYEIQQQQQQQQQQQDVQNRVNQPRVPFFPQPQQQQQPQYQQYQNQNQFGHLKGPTANMGPPRPNNTVHNTPGPEPHRQNSSSSPANIGAAAAAAAVAVSSSSSPYPAYGDDSSYLGLQYNMSASRAVEQQDQNNITPQPTHSQLAAAMTGPAMSERLYQPFGRR